MLLVCAPDPPAELGDVRAERLLRPPLRLRPAAERRVAEVPVVLLARVLSVPRRPVRVAILPSAALAEHDGLLGAAVVRLRVAAAEGASREGGDSGEEVSDEDGQISGVIDSSLA